MYYHRPGHDRAMRIECHWCAGSGHWAERPNADKLAQRATARVAQSQRANRRAIAPRMRPYLNDTRHLAPRPRRIR